MVLLAHAVVAERASAQTPSTDFVLSYAASRMQPGQHFDLTVTADLGTIGSPGAVPRRVVYPASVTAHEPATQPLRWTFTVPTGGTIAAKSFRFTFPHPVVASPGLKRLLFLTVDCSFDGLDRQRRPAVVHTHRMLVVPVGPDGPDGAVRCLQLSGLPGGAFNTGLQSNCSGGGG